MEETFYKRVNYPENKPEKEGEYQTDKGRLYWDGTIWNLGKGLKWHAHPQPTLFYKPLSISRDKMIEVIRDILQDNIPEIKWDATPGMIYDAILKSGLPEKKVEPIFNKGQYVKEKEGGRDWYGCSGCQNEVLSNHNFCPSCGSKILWK